MFNVLKRKSKNKDKFISIGSEVLQDFYGVKVKFRSCELFIYEDKGYPVLKVVDLDLNFLSNTDCTYFDSGEFCKFSVNKNGNLEGAIDTARRDGTSVSIVNLNSYVIDVKVFSSTLIVKLLDLDGVRIGSTSIEFIDLKLNSKVG